MTPAERPQERPATARSSAEKLLQGIGAWVDCLTETPEGTECFKEAFELIQLMKDIEESDSPWWIGPFGLVLRNVQPVQFIPVKGALGLFNWKRKIDQMGENA